jgi:hypothetical protein
MNIERDLARIKELLFKELAAEEKKELKIIYARLEMVSEEQHTTKDWRSIELAVKIVNYMLTVC